MFVVSQALKRDFLHGLLAGLTAVDPRRRVLLRRPGRLLQDQARTCRPTPCTVHQGRRRPSSSSCSPASSSATPGISRSPRTGTGSPRRRPSPSSGSSCSTSRIPTLYMFWIVGGRDGDRAQPPRPEPRPLRDLDTRSPSPSSVGIGSLDLVPRRSSASSAAASSRHQDRRPSAGSSSILGLALLGVRHRTPSGCVFIRAAMTRRERVERAWALEAVDKVPFVPAVYEHKARLIGRTPSQVCRSLDLLLEALEREDAIYGPDALTVGLDVYNVEAEAARLRRPLFRRLARRARGRSPHPRRAGRARPAGPARPGTRRPHAALRRGGRPPAEGEGRGGHGPRRGDRALLARLRPGRHRRGPGRDGRRPAFRQVAPRLRGPHGGRFRHGLPRKGRRAGPLRLQGLAGRARRPGSSANSSCPSTAISSSPSSARRARGRSRSSSAATRRRSSRTCWRPGPASSSATRDRTWPASAGDAGKSGGP
ncbi:MAG: hypothetical protein M0C28_45105 [Candidatus Moduliflexus flocculans]|nr:hypothetical protein [Candidatus Moduliflexus flocculans]